MRTTYWIAFQMVALVLAVGVPVSVWAASDDVSQNVNVTVGTVLSITTEGDPTLDLHFADFAEGAMSSGKTVIYTVRANNMTESALLGAVNAALGPHILDVGDVELGGIAIMGDPGEYINEGKEFYGTLKESAADFIPIGTSVTSMFDKPASSGAEGKLLIGKAPIHYRARALRDLTPRDGVRTTLTITLKDS